MLMSRQVSYRKTACIAVILFLLSPASYASLDDGFGAAKSAKGRYFTVYYAPQVELPGLIRNLDVTPQDKFLAGISPGGGLSAEEELTEALDTLFAQVCDILDMHLYSFQGNLKVCRDSSQLAQAYRMLFDKQLDAESFYVRDLNTIYISQENFRREILGHEIAHVITSHYFVVMPPEKIQELLAGYVEYQLRKPSQ